MKTVYESYTMDYTTRIQHAQRDDGQWFSRMRAKTPWGYTWTRWRMALEPSNKTAPKQCRVRLPKG